MLVLLLTFLSLVKGWSAPEDWLDQIFDSKNPSWIAGNETNQPEVSQHNSAPVSLACIPQVNVSLGQGGFAVITALMLVPDMDCLPFEYTVDIMGPLTNTVYCEQLGQNLQAVVTDCFGNSCMSTLYIEDKLKPLCIATPDVLPCNTVIADIPFEDYVEVQDNCDEDLDLWYSYVITPLGCNPSGYTVQIDVIWTATDDWGNSSTCEDVIYLQKPSLGEIDFPANVTVSCTNPNIDPSVTGEPTWNGLPIDYACQLTVWYTDVTLPMCSGAQKIRRTWTVMDWCNSGMITHVQEILIVDNTPPVLVCPVSITINANALGCTANYTLPNVLVTDNCAPASSIDVDFFVIGIPGIYSSGQVVQLPVGTTLINVRATDPCGNSSMCQYSVTVRDNTPPVIICPPNITVDCNGSTAPSVTGTATAIDFCDPTPTITYSDVTMATPGCAVGYKIIRTWMATDDSGNVAMCMQMITLTDSSPPLISCPSNTTIACTASTLPANTGTATATDHCDLTPTITWTDVTIAGSCPQERTINRTWSATDDCGNTSTCLQIIAVEDNLAPVITCPPDISIECSQSTLPSTTGTATATDNCDASVTITYTDVITPFGPQTFLITRTWSATDDCGNSSTCIQLIQVHDDTPPIITCPANLTIQCNTSTLPPATGTATATDACDPGVTITFSDITTGGGCPQELNITRTWTATDDCGNSSTCTQTIFVDDSTGPAITCPANITVLCTGSTLPAATGTATATDNCDPSATITFSDVTIAGICLSERTINRTWIATDDCGNSNTCLQVIFVDDNQAPLITCPPNITISCTASTLPPNTGNATATDNCNPNPFISFSDNTIGGICPQEMTIIRTFTAQDFCGNSSSCTQTIVVDDSTPPVITCPPSVTISCTASTLPPNTGTATATDNCTANVIIGSSDVVVPGACPQEMTITRTWTAQDGCGNSSSCTQIIVVDDNVGPVITCPANITIACGQSTLPPATGTATATDNCDPTVAITFSDAVVGGGCPQESTITRTWSATDDCGNSTTCVQIIVVDDSAAPAITCPPNLTINCSDSTLPASTGFATATDNCDATPTITFSDVTAGPGCPEESTITRTWSATDDCGNVSTCVQVITIDDNVAPLISCPVNVTVECTASTAPASTGTATATDVCDATPTITFTDAFAAGICPGLGTISRTWIATDDCGNSSTCSQSIVVDDNVPPICAAQNITVNIGGGTITVQASEVDNGSSDACGPVTLSLVPNTFTCDDLGPNPVVLTVTDCSGNTSTCTATVTIDDSGGLQANCQDVTIFLDANGQASIDPSDVDNGSGGGCNSGDLEYELSQTEFDCGDLGQTIVILTVTDENGATATCTAIITVIDNIPPTIQCPQNVTVECHTVMDPNNTSQFGNATGDDNCDFVTITETHILNLNDCDVGTIIRTFTATDLSGNTATCTQLVTIINQDPLDESDITWPTSPLSVNICNSSDPPATGIPVIDPQALLCANVTVSHSDVMVMNVDNNPNTPCKVIMRTWTVTDLCQPATFTFVQTINVEDPTPPNFTNINDMTKVANANCVAFFTLIANATDCSGVTITNNSPYGVNSGANASGNYPIGVTTVIFTATDGCGNISTMDVVITVTDPDPTQMMCEKVIFILPPETEISIAAEEFVTFIEGNCSNSDDFIISYSGTLPFDTVHIFDCGDVGVTTFPLWMWTADGTMIVDSCNTADLDLRDPNDYCEDGLNLTGEVKSEDGLPVSEVEVSVMNAQMVPDTTDLKGGFLLGGLNKHTPYGITAYHDRKHRAGVSTLDLVMIQKHLLGLAKLSSPFKMIAADANRSGVITALDLLEIRKLILGINNKFPNNTSWRFVDRLYEFPDPHDPFKPGFPESVWLDSITNGLSRVNFTGIKIGDVNGSYFSNFAGDQIESRSDAHLDMRIHTSLVTGGSARWEMRLDDENGVMAGMQFSLQVGDYTSDQLKEICSDVIPADQWYYNPATRTINVSWTPSAPVDIAGKMVLCGPLNTAGEIKFTLENDILSAEGYEQAGENYLVHPLRLNGPDVEVAEEAEYQLFQNIPNPFDHETRIQFTVPGRETVTILIHDVTGRKIMEREIECVPGFNEMVIDASDLKAAGIYYYTMKTATTSMTRKMSNTTN